MDHFLYIVTLEPAPRATFELLFCYFHVFGVSDPVGPWPLRSQAVVVTLVGTVPGL